MSARPHPRPAPETRLRRAEDAWLADATDRLRHARPRHQPARPAPARPIRTDRTEDLDD